MAFLATVIGGGSGTFRAYGGTCEYRLEPSGTWLNSTDGDLEYLWSSGTWTIKSTDITSIRFFGSGITHVSITDASILTSAYRLVKSQVALLECYVDSTNLITNYDEAFSSCQNLHTLDTGMTSLCTTASEMCVSGLSLVNLASCDYSNVTDATDIFMYCTSLTIFKDDIGGIGDGAFEGCTALVAITGLLDFTDYNRTFYNCTSLEYIKGVDTVGASNNANMFYYTTALTTPNAATQTLLETTSMSWVASNTYITTAIFEHGDRTISPMTSITFEHGDRTVDKRITTTFELDRYIYKKSLSTFSLKRTVASNTLQTQRFRSVRKVDAETQSSTIIARTTV